LDPSRWIDQYGDYLYAYAVRRLRSPEGAEEVVQETFFAALRAREQFRGTGSEQAWLLGILKRKILDVFRARQRAGFQAGGEDGQDLETLLFDEKGHWRSGVKRACPLPAEVAEKAEFWTALTRCLGELPARQAEVFSLRELDGLDSKEICKELEITPSNLWVLLHRARLGLAQCLGTAWSAEGAAP
jgi:RNA polymerase sigma-70 factor (ECF subfamily)